MDRKMCNRREFLAGMGTAAAGVALAPCLFAEEMGAARPNVLLITADDMNYDSLGVTGCKIPNITPNIDALAKQGMLFRQAHVTSAICQPSRSSLMTGRFPHRNGAMGFQPIDPNIPTLQESLRAAGYLNGIMAKITHLMPRPKFCWDFEADGADLGSGKDPELYYKQSRTFFEQAKAAGKPFFLMANAQDPHRPFPGSERGGKARKANLGDPAPPSRTYKPDEVPVPGFLPQNVEGVKEELAQYFTAVHRCDESVGQVLRALRETGLEDNTLVMFLTDNGISQPFAKTCCYFSSTACSLIVRWPGKVKPGVVNNDDLVSGIDFMPTVLDAVGAKPVEGLDGRSYVPVLRGSKQEGRDRVFSFITRTSAGNDFPMRCVRTKRYSFIFNAWADGKTRFQNEPQGGLAFRSMQAAAESDPRIAERVRFFLYRAPEEFYDLQGDPHELINRIDDPKYRPEIDKLKAELRKMMESSKDPLLGKFKE